MIKVTTAQLAAHYAGIFHAHEISDRLVSAIASRDIQVLHNLRSIGGADTILALFDGAGLGSERKGSQGTAWGLVNAVTEYYDHHVTAKSVDHRLQRAWFGSGDKIKVEAMNLAVEQFV